MKGVVGGGGGRGDCSYVLKLAAAWCLLTVSESQEANTNNKIAKSQFANVDYPHIPTENMLSDADPKLVDVDPPRI